MEERGEKMRVADGNGQFDQDVVVSKTTLLEAATISVFLSWKMIRAYLSVVNLPSLYAATNEGDNLYARRFKVPCELLLTS